MKTEDSSAAIARTARGAGVALLAGAVFGSVIYLTLLKIGNAVERSEYIRQIGEELRIGEEMIRTALRKSLYELSES